MNRFVIALFVFAAPTWAANYTHSGLVDDILISENFGQCAVKISGFPAPGTCGANWLSLDCEGLVVSKAQGRAMLESAQMAFALEKELVVWFSDDQLVNGRCITYQTRLKR